MSKHKNRSIANDLVTKRIDALTEAHQTNEHDLRNDLQLLEARLEGSINTQIDELRTIIEDLKSKRADQIKDLETSLLLIINTRAADLRVIVEDLNRNRGDQLGILNARINDFGTKLSTHDAAITDFQAFIVDQGGISDAPD